MFKKLRKWYFKLYHLFRFLGIFVLMFGIQKNVYAECENIIPEDLKMYYSSRYSFYAFNTFYIPEIIQGDTYTIYINKGDITFREFLSENGLINTTWTPVVRVFSENSNTAGNQCDLDKNYCSQIANFTGNSGAFQLQMIENGTQANTQTILNSLQSSFKFVHGDESCLPVDEPEPPAPENNVYSNFLTLYTDRLNYLAEGATNNPYLITMIGIIFAWVVLELFLHILHLRGGYHK